MDDKSENQLILYQTEDGETRIQVTLLDETVWLTQKQIVELFQRDKSVIETARKTHSLQRWDIRACSFAR